VNTDFDSRPEFNEWIDSQHREENGPLSILGTTIRPSEALYLLARDTYEAAYSDFLADKQNQICESVFSDYPTLIAYYFYRFEHGYEDETQRLHFLRSTWEAVINLIHALIVSEARCRTLDLSGSKLKLSNLLTDRLAQRLQNVQSILSFAKEDGTPLDTANIIPEDTIKKMATLNQTRNAFLHTAAQSVDQAKQYISETYEDVLNILEDLSGLKEVYLVRYRNQEGLKLRYESFDGHAMTRTITEKEITQNQFNTANRFFNQEQILAFYDETILSLKPFLHFQISASGHETRLCIFKKTSGNPPNRNITFEIIGESREILLDRAIFQNEINELRALFGLEPEA